MDRVFAMWGAASGFVAVMAGAFGAHALKARVAPAMLAVFETGVRYQAMHALALLACAWAWQRWPGRWSVAAGLAFAGGTVLFSGSLYLLALTGTRELGAVTPLGGALFLGGWACLFVAAWRDGRRAGEGAVR